MQSKHIELARELAAKHPIARKPHGKDINTARKGVSLEHRHFAFIAGVIAGMKGQDYQDRVAMDFMHACKATNPKFDKQRFIAACQLEQVS